MVTLQELHQARKDLNNAGASIIFQAEGLGNVFNGWFGVKNPYDITDMELAFLKEMLALWKTGNYNLDNLKRVVGNNAYDLENVFNRLKDLKNNGKNLGSIDLNRYIKENQG